MNTEHFYPELGYQFPSFPYLSFDRALNVAARTLCRIGLVWRKELYPMSWEAGEPTYYPGIPTNTRIVQIITLGDLAATTPQKLSALDPDWRSTTGSPTHYYRLDDQSIRVYPTPGDDAPDAVTPVVALAPITESKTLHDDYAWNYERLLLQGAIAHLGGLNWFDFEHLCYGARSRAVDNDHVGVARTVRYGGL